MPLPMPPPPPTLVSRSMSPLTLSNRPPLTPYPHRRRTVARCSRASLSTTPAQPRQCLFPHVSATAVSRLPRALGPWCMPITAVTTPRRRAASLLLLDVPRTGHRGKAATTASRTSHPPPLPPSPAVPAVLDGAGRGSASRRRSCRGPCGPGSGNAEKLPRRPLPKNKKDNRTMSPTTRTKQPTIITTNNQQEISLSFSPLHFLCTIFVFCFLLAYALYSVERLLSCFLFSRHMVPWSAFSGFVSFHSRRRLFFTRRQLVYKGNTDNAFSGITFIISLGNGHLIIWRYWQYWQTNWRLL